MGKLGRFSRPCSKCSLTEVASERLSHKKAENTQRMVKKVPEIRGYFEEYFS